MASPQVFVVKNNAQSLSIFQNNSTIPAFWTGLTSGSATGIQVGGAAYGIFQGVMTSFVIYNSALSSANIQLAQQAAYRDNGLSPQAKNNILVFGDSEICCTGGTIPSYQKFSQAFQLLLNDPVYLYDRGLAGETYSSGNTALAGVLPLAKVSGMNNILFDEEGTNDIAANAAAATVYGYQQAACTAAHSAGYKCFIMSLLPRTGAFSNGQNSAGFETQRQALYALDLAGWPSFADGFVDMTGDPVLGLQATANNSTYFGDNVHWTLFGQTFGAGIAARGFSGVAQ